MKKQGSICLIFLFLLATTAFCQDEEPIKESISVVNVEVLVRVFSHGKPITDLKKEDFAIYEDGKLQEVNGFDHYVKKIAQKEPDTSQLNPNPSRYFVLVFQVYDFNQHLRDGLNYMFDKVLSPQDQLLVFINNRTREYNDLQAKEKIHAEIELDLKEQSHTALNLMRGNLRELDYLVKTTKSAIQNKTALQSTPAMLSEFLNKFLVVLTDYKRRFLTQDTDQFYFFAKHLEKIKKEKWVVSFYQIAMLPRFSVNRDLIMLVQYVIDDCQGSGNAELNSFGRILTRLLQAIEKESMTGVEFPAKDIGKLFLKSNATFHSILMNTQIDADNQDLNFNQISSNVESSLRELTKNTGGALISSTDLVSSLSTLSQIEDSYYMLSFSPQIANKVGKIKVNVPNKDYDILYDDNQKADYIAKYLNKKTDDNPNVKISGLAMAGKKLTLNITDIALNMTENGSDNGVLQIRISILNDLKQNVYDKSKSLKVNKKSSLLTIEFPFLDIGQYDLTADIVDQVSGKNASQTIQFEIF